jgi:hypothetical protein
MAEKHEKYVPLETLEHCLVLAAYFVVQYGPVYAPILRRMEREVEKARREDPIAAANRILTAYTEEGGLNAMRLRNLSLCSKV